MTNRISNEPQRGIPDFGNLQHSGIPWRMLIIATRVVHSAEVIRKAGPAFPLLLAYIRRIDGTGVVEGVFYSELAAELDVSLSATKKWTAHLEEKGLLKKCSQGRNGIRIELPMPEVDTCPIDAIRELINGLSARLNSFEHSVEAGFSVAHQYLDTLVGEQVD